MAADSMSHLPLRLAVNVKKTFALMISHMIFHSRRQGPASNARCDYPASEAVRPQALASIMHAGFFA